MAPVLAGHIILTLTPPAESGRPKLARVEPRTA